MDEGCQKFVSEYDNKGNGQHFICQKDLLCRDCLSSQKVKTTDSVPEKELNSVPEKSSSSNSEVVSNG